MKGFRRFVLRRPSAAGALLAALGLHAPLAFAAGSNPDTGVTALQCFEAGTDSLVPCNSAGALALNSHQDGMVGRDLTDSRARDGVLGFDFVKIGADGSTLPNSATHWSCVRDKITGGLSEAKTTDGGLHDRDKGYTNWGDRREGDASALDAAAKAERLCGASRWRLPTVSELQSLVDYGLASGSGPLVDTAFFPNIVASLYWSSEAKALADNSVTILSFEGGFINWQLRTNPLRVMLVR